MARKKIDRKDDRKTRVFLSYSRKDLGFAEFLKGELEQAGYQPSLDKTDIAPGEAWQDRLGKLIQEADAIVFCLSSHSAVSAICGWEVEAAAKLGKRIVPAVVDFVDPTSLPETLTKLNFIFFADTSFEEAFTNLQSALNTNLAWVRLHTRLGELALEWQARNNSTSQLLFGRSLSDAEIWSAKRPSDAELPTPLQLQYIAASRSAASGRQRLGLFAALAAATVAIALFIWGLFNQFDAIDQKEKAQAVANAAINAAESISVDVVTDLSSRSGVPPQAIQSVLEITAKMQNDLINSGAIAPAIKASLVSTYMQLALIHKSQGHVEEALANATKATQQADDVKKIIDELPSKTPDDMRVQNVNLTNRAASYSVLGDIQSNMNDDYAKSKASYETEIESAKLITEDYAGKTNRDTRIAIGQMNLGDSQFMLNETEQALSTAILANETFKSLLREKPLANNEYKVDQCNYPIAKVDDASIQKQYLSFETDILDLIGRILTRQKHFVEAEKYLCEALNNAIAISADKPDDLAAKRVVNQARKTFAINLHEQGGAKNARAFMLADAQQNLAKELYDLNQSNTLLLDDYAVALLLKANYASPSSAPEFFATQYKAYAELRLKSAIQNPTDPVVLEQLVVAYEILLENNLRAEEADTANLRGFITAMEKLYSSSVSSKPERAEIAKKALASIVPTP